MKMSMKYGGGSKVITQIRDHEIVADQSIEEGGENTAANPFEYFFSSIGACTATYVYRFCEARGIPCENITVELDVPADENGILTNKINMHVHVPDDFPEKYKRAVVRSAEQCSVKKFIQASPEIEISI